MKHGVLSPLPTGPLSGTGDRVCLLQKFERRNRAVRAGALGTCLATCCPCDPSLRASLFPWPSSTSFPGVDTAFPGGLGAVDSQGEAGQSPTAGTGMRLPSPSRGPNCVGCGYKPKENLPAPTAQGSKHRAGSRTSNCVIRNLFSPRLCSLSSGAPFLSLQMGAQAAPDSSRLIYPTRAAREGEMVGGRGGGREGNLQRPRWLLVGQAWVARRLTGGAG